MLTQPRIPNLPFFYLVYRAWSHWRALAGGKHVQWLVDNKLLLPSPSETLNKLYKQDGPPTDEGSTAEQMLLTQKQVRNFSQTLDVPALEIELERATWQVAKAIESSKETADTKSDEKKEQ